MTKKNLSDDERHRAVCLLLESSKNSFGGDNLKPERGKISEVAKLFNVSRRSICTIWTAAKNQRLMKVPINVKSKMKGKKGKERIPCPIELIKSLEVGKRTSIKKLSKAIKISRGTVHRWVQHGILKGHTNAIKPDLTQDNKYLRLNFVMAKLLFDRLLRCVKFKDMDYIIHIDEKWFYMTKASRRFYVVNDEDLPHRTCKSKRFITKVMFLAAVSRPLYDENGELIFDGKIGIFPFVYQEPAKRRSKNRIAGTIVTKPIESITKQVTKDMLINQLIPAIKQKWPATSSKNIVIQQDNAKPHIKGNEPDFMEAANSDGFNMKLTQQPPNSPDLNILNLGFFRSIQSLQEDYPAKTVEELVNNVQQAWEEEAPETLDNVWLSLQACMVDIMKVKGQNNYPLPHLAKQALRSQGLLPRNLAVEDDLVRECIQFLITCGLTENLDQLMSDLGIQVPF